MTQDEIIEMAKEFGLSVGVALNGSKSMGKHENKSFAVGRLPLEDFVSFVQLMVAKERAACEKACEDERNDPDDQFKNYEDTHTDGWIDGCNSCISAIRARNKLTSKGEAS